jgi:hypothetical protein
LKSRLQKLDELTDTKPKENIENVINKIPKDKYKNIFERPEKYIPKNKTRRVIPVYQISFLITKKIK